LQQRPQSRVVIKILLEYQLLQKIYSLARIKKARNKKARKEKEKQIKTSILCTVL
jgi:hypothetical protein